MHYERNSFDLLAHFDHPKSCDLQPVGRTHVSKRGIRWVLKWAVAMAILTVAASMVTEFAYVLAADHRLNTAARAGVSEAMLPRATIDTVRAAVERRIGNAGLFHHLQLTILQNGQPVQQQIRQGENDRFAVSISLPSSDLVPKWVRTLNPSHRESLLFAHAESQVPGRKLAYRMPSQTAAE
jgi:hypothetical protein